jgi:hypothetical protein
LFPAEGGHRLLMPFARLLQLASRQYILVAQLGLDRPRRFLTWEASLLPAQHRPTPRDSPMLFHFLGSGTADLTKPTPRSRLA